MQSETEIAAPPTALMQLLASAPNDVVPKSSGMVFDRETKYVSWEFSPKKFDRLELVQITDMQFGHIACKVKRVKEYRDWVLSDPCRYMLWTGDNVDAWRLGSPGSPYDQIGDPQSQVYKFCEIWAPARHRILGYVGGNHERRGSAGFGDLGLLLATLLQVPYSGGRQFIDIKFGKHAPFKIDLWHGVGGARTKGTVAQILDRFMQQGQADLYLMGHVHQPLILPGWKQHRDTEKQRIVLKKCFGAVGSSFLDTWGTYGEIAGYAAHDVLMARCVLTPDGKSELTLK